MKDSSSGDDLSARQGLKKSLTSETSELDSNDELEASKKLGKRRPKPISRANVLHLSIRANVLHLSIRANVLHLSIRANVLHLSVRAIFLHFSIRANPLHLSIRANLLKLSTKNSLLHCCTRSKLLNLFSRANLLTPLHWKQPPIPLCQGQTHSHQRQPPLPLLQRPPCLLASPTLLLKCLYQLSEWHQGESLFFVP
ncbi:hypothetical protein AOLI_G00324090, partial [Acnodon oligacanthus]